MNKIKNQIIKLEKELGWSKTSKEQIMKFINKDIKELNKTKGRDKHKIIDIFIELIQLSIRNKINLDKKLQKHILDIKKKYRVKKK